MVEVKPYDSRWPDELQAARYALMRSHTWIQHAALALHPVEWNRNTLAVDRYWRLYWDRKFVQSRTLEDLTFILYHELWHALWEDTGPMYEDLNAISHKALNMAQDIRINDFIRQEKGMPVPSDALLPETFGFPPKLSCREYFELLMKMSKQCSKCGAKYIEMPGQGGDQGGQGGGKKQEGQEGQGGHHCHEDGCGCTAQPELGDAAGAPRREDGQLIREITAQELEREQRERGSGSCDYGGWLEAFRNPPVDPKRLLRRALTNLIHAPGIEDYSWSRPNNRQPRGSKVLMPGMVDGRPGHVAIVVDTSGSMADAEVAAALSICNAVFAYADRVTEIQCDTVAQKSRGAGRKQRQIYHRGGTDMGVGIQAAERERPDLLVVISDCETPWPDKPPKMPTVIVRVGNGGQLPPWKVVDVVDMKVGRKG